MEASRHTYIHIYIHSRCACIRNRSLGFAWIPSNCLGTWTLAVLKNDLVSRQLLEAGSLKLNFSKDTGLLQPPLWSPMQL